MNNLHLLKLFNKTPSLVGTWAASAKFGDVIQFVDMFCVKIRSYFQSCPYFQVDHHTSSLLEIFNFLHDEEGMVEFRFDLDVFLYWNYLLYLWYIVLLTVKL